MSSETLPLYERESLLREAWANLRSLARFRELLRHLVRASLARESTGTVLGVVWWLLDPLLLMAVFVFFVDVVLNAGGENYALFVLIGVLAWKHVQSGIQGGIASTVSREQLMRQVAFPKAVLPLSAAFAATFHFFIGIALFLLVAIAFGIYPNVLFPLVFVIAAVQLALVLGLAFALSALNIFMRDVQNLTAYALRLGFFLSPVLYAVPRIPEDYRAWYELNPFATIVPAYRSVLIDGELPDLSALGIVAIVSVVMLVSGYLLFVRLEQSFTKLS